MTNFFKKHTYTPFIFSALLLSLTMWYLQSFYIFVYFFLIPILFYIDAVKLDFFNKKEVWKEFFKMFLFGLLFSSISSLHFFSTFPLDWAGINSFPLSFFIVFSIWLSFGVMMALPVGLWLISFRFLRSNNIFSNSILGASLWVLLEYFRSWWVAVALFGKETLFGPHHTYYSLAHPVAHTPLLKELVPVGGIYLASFMVIVINFFFYYSIFNLFKKNKKYTTFYIHILFLVVIISGSYFLMNNIRDDTKQEIIATVVNTNISDEQNERLSIEEQADLIGKTINEKSDIIVVPESTPLILQFLTNGLELTKEAKRHLIIGSYTGGELRNLVFFDDVSGRVEYEHKQLLMPIGEYSISWLKYLMFIFNSKWLEKYELAIPDIKKGREIVVYKDKTKENFFVGGFLCSENISPYLYREATKKGATLLVNLSSRASFRGSELLSRQSISVNTLRALENGRYMIVASNYDKSYVIDDRGNITNTSTGKEKYSYFNSKIVPKTYLTPYVHYGDYILVVSLLILISAAILKPSGTKK